ncbi:MAG: CvpA family protein [Geminicoccaceae bacterium]
MSELSLTAFDIAALLVIAVSALLSLVRGATREALTILTWGGACVAAYYGFGYAQDLARRTIETDLMADAAALVVVFVVPLIAFKALAAALMERMPGGAFGTLDRIGGVLFGLFRGAVVVCMGYLGLTMLVEGTENQPVWVKDAALLPYVQQGAGLLERLVPKGIEPTGRQTVDQIKESHKALRRVGETVQELSAQ